MAMTAENCSSDDGHHDFGAELRMQHGDPEEMVRPPGRSVLRKHGSHSGMAGGVAAHTPVLERLGIFGASRAPALQSGEKAWK